MTMNVVLVDGAITAGAATAENAYTSPAGGKGTRITAITCTNISGATDNFTIYTKTDATAPALSDSLIIEKSLVAKESDTPPEVINHLVEPGGTLWIETATAGSVTFKVAGIEFT